MIISVSNSYVLGFGLSNNRAAPWIRPAIKLLEGPRTFGTRYGQW
jgi:hypothetical protein